jgi:hypothetical protein
MDDKTPSRLQPSTTFDDSFQSTTHSVVRPLTSSPTYPSTTFNTYLPGINQLVGMERKDAFEVRNNMLSPPEPIPQDSFPRTFSTSSMDFKMTGPAMSIVKAQQPMTPPISPASKNSLPEVSPSTEVRDPILYPNSDPSPQSPLFRVNDTLRVVDEHVAAREPTPFRSVSPPRHSEYQLALEFKSQMGRAFLSNPRLWAQRELAQLKEDNALKMGGRRYTTIAPATSGIRRPFGPKPIRQSGVKNGGPKPSRVTKPPTGARGTTPDTAKRVAREDKDFSSLPDYCPPLESLPNKPNSLKVDWKGAPIDLRHDPHYHLLHPDEVALAANLRLDCATYLTSKRRIFIKRIEAYKIGKEFRKTDAQQACKIDVNKASKLWQAFDKVGWLQAKWIVKYV